MAEEAKVVEGVPVEPTKITRDVNECFVDSVTVFCDRAEVTRKCFIDVDAKGSYEVVIEGLPDCVDKDSVRVDGTGHVTLQEVGYAVHHKTITLEDAKPAVTGTADELQEQLKAKQKELTLLGVSEDEVHASQAMLTRVSDSLLARTKTGKSLDDMEALLKFGLTLVDTTAAKAAELHEQLRKLQGAKEALQQEIQVLQNNLHALGHYRPRTTNKVSRDVTVAFDASQPGAVNLRIIYMVSKASWTPAYDCRINSNDTSVSLTYYGHVQQQTGENWENAQLVLSTATPSVGGTAPVLQTKHIAFQQRRAKLHARFRGMPGGAMPEMERAPVAEMAVTNMQAEMFDSSSSESEDDDLPEANVATSKVSDSGAATTFHIARRATVNSDNKQHKVTVAILALKGFFRYYTVPALNQCAYLQCLTKNTSDYTLLASDSVNVFLDNSFVSKTSLSNVSPGQRFRQFLGVDKAVKIVYKAVSAVHAQKGMFSKSDTTTYRFVTTVHNNKAFDINVVLADMLPVSDDDAIKVKLVQPTMEQVEAGNKAEKEEETTRAARPAAGGAGLGAGADANVNLVAQNAVTKNLVWKRGVAQGSKVEIPFEYIVEHPSGRTVHTYQA